MDMGFPIKSFLFLPIDSGNQPLLSFSISLFLSHVTSTCSVPYAAACIARMHVNSYANSKKGNWSTHPAASLFIRDIFQHINILPTAEPQLASQSLRREAHRCSFSSWLSSACALLCSEGAVSI